MSLPTRPQLGADEALDNYLERVAAANDVSTAALIASLTQTKAGDRAPRTTFLMYAPDARLIDAIQRLTDAPATDIRSATLDRYGKGRPLHLEALDVYDKNSLRIAAGQGWLPGHGSQACPTCLADTQLWDISWRLPISAVCLRHGSYLLPECPCCRRPFRAHRSQPLRSTPWPDIACGNPLGDGEHCPTQIGSIVSAPATRAEFHTARRIQKACRGRPMSVLGETLSPARYLATVKGLAVLILHLAGRAGAGDVALWTEHLRGDPRSRASTQRRPRWGLTPPSSAQLRAAALDSADHILTADDTPAGATRLAAWTALTPTTNDGPLGWLADRTVMTPTISRLIIGSLAPRRRVSHQLTGTVACLPASAIPQVLSQDVYDQHFAAMLGSRDVTGRLYVSLCLARRQPGVATWDDAAKLLGLRPETGERTASTASARMHATAAAFTVAVEAAERSMPNLINYRELEEGVRSLTTDASWFPAWRREHRRGTPITSIGYVITKIWCDEARGDLAHSPGWPTAPTATQRRSYRLFTARTSQST